MLPSWAKHLIRLPPKRTGPVHVASDLKDFGWRKLRRRNVLRDNRRRREAKFFGLTFCDLCGGLKQSLGSPLSTIGSPLLGMSPGYPGGCGDSLCGCGAWECVNNTCIQQNNGSFLTQQECLDSGCGVGSDCTLCVGDVPDQVEIDLSGFPDTSHPCPAAFNIDENYDCSRANGAYILDRIPGKCVWFLEDSETGICSTSENNMFASVEIFGRPNVGMFEVDMRASSGFQNPAVLIYRSTSFPLPLDCINISDFVLTENGAIPACTGTVMWTFL